MAVLSWVHTAYLVMLAALVLGCLWTARRIE